MMKALYYPHTDVTNPLIIKNALLLWDSIETIVPRPRWTPRRLQGNKVFNEAVDLVVQPRVPTTSERHEAHDVLQRLNENGKVGLLLKMSPPAWRSREFLIYPEKFLEQTWHLLEREGMARWVAGYHDCGVSPALGFLMLSFLADACAGTQIQKVTDRVDAYAWLSEHYADLLDRPYVKGLDVSQVAPAYDRLVTLSMEVLDARAIPLRNLVEFRKRESGRGGADYIAMRRRYLKALQSHLKRIGTEVRSSGDVRELDRQFKEGLKEDLADLKEELRAASLKTLFSKEVALSALISAGCLLSPVAGLTELASDVGAIGVIPLLKAAVDYRGTRRAAIQRHVTSWLYLASRRGVRLY